MVTELFLPNTFKNRLVVYGKQYLVKDRNLLTQRIDFVRNYAAEPGRRVFPGAESIRCMRVIRAATTL